MSICKGFNRFVLGFAATLYLLVGIALIAASTATFFTVFKDIIAPVYAISFLGLGIVILLVSISGFLAACGKHKCWLSIFMLFDVLIIALFVIAVVIMFYYENVLQLASEVHAQNQITAGINGLDTLQTEMVETLTTNTLNVCNGTTTLDLSPTEVYDFTCGNKDSLMQSLAASIDLCVKNPINASVGTFMYGCYHSTVWNETTPLQQPSTDANLVPVLNTPKGLYCACSSTIMHDFILKYVYIFKWVGIGVAVFFLLIFFSCCYLCCCAPKAKDEDPRAIEFTQQQHGWSAGNVGYSQKNTGKKRLGNSDAYIARP